ncbi:hypothetical protein U717_14725 [Rhodobacter capsulatus R121]|nr:hypothetical protein U714_14570 [Rhodobacter capsulatus DE442]ETD75251.1 hypothetical protein U717_14725 [Rhodobacter capsulatus R121]ETE52682.1 hypothetical protein U715_14720 [Rhodobacter capsulatus Y262]
MAMTDRFEFEDADLERFFRAARTAAPAPSGDFLARLTDQAEGLQPRPAVPGPRRRGRVAALATALGGWAALGGFAGGMATATVAGLWIGLAGTPTLVQAVGLGSAVSTASAETDNYLPDADVLALAVMQ